MRIYLIRCLRQLKGTWLIRISADPSTDLLLASYCRLYWTIVLRRFQITDYREGNHVQQVAVLFGVILVLSLVLR